MSKKQILLNAFSMNCVGHINHGLWTHPRDRSSDYRKLRHWTELARLLERGLFDGLFIADILGVYDVYQGGIEVTAREAVQLPVNDPLMLVSAMAGVTEHLGFGVTANLTYEAPYPFARRLSTLDHLSDGRIGWNIVTGYLESAAKAMGQSAQIEHDRRYDRADEYLEVLYKLWEGSWEDDAVLADRQRRVYARPEKIHKIRHHGEFYQVEGYHLAEPSPQRTPGAVPGRLLGAWPGLRRAPRRNACSSPDRPARPPANWCSASARRWSAPAVAPRTSGSSWAST
ncbi:putative monooxygenase, DszA family protein [Pseudomonas aeruginosa]|nr:putative monooxygenase, DszA family protein [Pseudomonas aeruginosa]